MLKKLIIIENGQEYQSDTLQNIVKILIDKNYYKMKQTQKIEIMKMKALANCMNNKMEVVQYFETNEDNNINGKFIIKDEITYILSLLTTNNILLLERKDSEIFTKDLNKENFKDNYIIVNKFANDLLKKYLTEMPKSKMDV